MEEKTELEKANLFIALAYSMFPEARVEITDAGAIVIFLGVYEGWPETVLDFP